MSNTLNDRLAPGKLQGDDETTAIALANIVIAYAARKRLGAHVIERAGTVIAESIRHTRSKQPTH